MQPVGISKRIGCWSGDDGNVNVDILVLDASVAAAVRSEDSRPFHISTRTIVTQGAIDAALYMVDDTGFQMIDDGLLAGECGAGKPPCVFDAHFGHSIEDAVGDFVSISEMMMCGDSHSITEACFL